MKKLKEYFDGLSPAKKKVAVMAVVMAVFGGTLYLGYVYRSNGVGSQSVQASRAKKVTLDTRFLEKAYSENIQREFKRRDEELDRIKALMEDMERKLAEKEKEKEKGLLPGAAERGPETGGARRRSGAPSHPYPPPPPGRLTDRSGEAAARKIEKPQPVGGIEIVEDAGKAAGPGAESREEPEEAEKEEKRRSVYLPPSFMDATLLTGFSAATMQGAKTYEKPLLLRVKDIAVLPNDVKADLKGCFIIASAHGDLADERAHARLVSLTCISRNGQSVIDSPIKGFIVDSDGKIGLSGNVVTKSGALLGRSVIAGFFGGVGDAFRAASTTTSISSLGATQTVDSDQIVQAGIGGGLAEGFDQLQRFYLDMARQTFPVIEVGAAKNVTVVIEEGVELEIKEHCVGEFNRCAEDEKGGL